MNEPVFAPEGNPQQMAFLRVIEINAVVDLVDHLAQQRPVLHVLVRIQEHFFTTLGSP